MSRVILPSSFVRDKKLVDKARHAIWVTPQINDCVNVRNFQNNKNVENDITKIIQTGNEI